MSTITGAQQALIASMNIKAGLVQLRQGNKVPAAICLTIGGALTAMAAYNWAQVANNIAVRSAAHRRNEERRLAQYHHPSSKRFLDAYTEIKKN